MTTITLEVPNRLAQRLNFERDRLPQVLELALQQLPPRPVNTVPVAVAPALAFTEMIEFLSGHPTAEQILGFCISPPAQANLSDLLEKNREMCIGQRHDEIQNSQIRLANSLGERPAMGRPWWGRSLYSARN